MISSRTPEGPLNRCPVCGSVVSIEPSLPTGDAPCPRCGHLLWFFALFPTTTLLLPAEDTARRQRVLDLVAETLGVERDELLAHSSGDLSLGADSLDLVDLVVALEDELG